MSEMEKEALINKANAQRTKVQLIEKYKEYIRSKKNNAERVDRRGIPN